MHNALYPHGDYDHGGEIFNIIKKFKVEEIIINKGKNSTLEESLIEKFKNTVKNKINKNNYYQILNIKEFDDENDDSTILKFNIYNQQILLMGDAGLKAEENLLKKYDLRNIDILKVGHHGSKTSSSNYFIDYINPKYSIISVGKNNRYGHPNIEVLETLKNSVIYRTDKSGTITFKINKNKLKPEINPP